MSNRPSSMPVRPNIMPKKWRKQHRWQRKRPKLLQRMLTSESKPSCRPKLMYDQQHLVSMLPWACPCDCGVVEHVVEHAKSLQGPGPGNKAVFCVVPQSFGLKQGTLAVVVRRDPVQQAGLQSSVADIESARLAGMMYLSCDGLGLPECSTGQTSP